MIELVNDIRINWFEYKPDEFIATECNQMKESERTGDWEQI